MKRSLLALAVLGAFAATAHAQSSVTVYGSFDAGVRNLSNVNAAGDSNLTMGSPGTFNSNRIGFRGTEDLGGGWAARFALEGEFNSGTGAQRPTVALFGRSAWVGLTTPIGMVDLGHQYSVNFKTVGGYDPFAYKYTGIIPLAALAGLTRTSNSIQYTGAFGPVVARAEYGLGEVAGDTGANATMAVGASAKFGAFSFGGAYTTKSNATDTADQDVWTVGGAWASGPFRVAAGYANDERDVGAGTPPAVAATEIRNAWIGGSYNVTPAVQVSAAWYQTKTEVGAGTGRRNLAIVGATYALSKRTNLYADIDRANLKGLALIGGVQTSQTGVSVGVNHLF